MALKDVYSQQAFAPSQQLFQQQSQSAMRLPGLEAQGFANAEAKAQQQQMNRPVTPWQKAIMRLMAGEDPARVAADTKGELGGAPGSAGSESYSGPTGGGGMPQMPQMPQQGQMPQYMPEGNMVGAMPQRIASANYQFSPSYNSVPATAAPVNTIDMGGSPTALGGPQTREVSQNRRPLPAAQSFAMERNAPPSQGLSNVNTWRGKGGLQEGDFNDMTGRDYNQFVDSMGKAGQMRYQKSYSDMMAIEQERTRRALDVEDKRSKSRKEVAEIRRDMDKEKLTAKEYADELSRRIKGKELDEKTAHHIAEINLGYARINELRERFSMARDQTDRLELAKLLVKDANEQEDNFAKVESSLTGLVGMNQMDIKADVARRKTEIAAARKLADEEIKRQKNAAPSGGKVETSGEKEKKPAGKQSRKWKVGESFVRNGQTHTVKAVDSEGRIASYE